VFLIIPEYRRISHVDVKLLSSFTCIHAERLCLTIQNRYI